MKEKEKIENCPHCGYPSIYGHATDCSVYSESLSREEFKAEMKEGAETVKKQEEAEKAVQSFYQWYESQGGFEDLYKDRKKIEKEDKNKYYEVARNLSEKLLKGLFRAEIRVEGQDNLKGISKNKGILMVVNHQSPIDPEILMASLPDRQLRFLAAQRINYGTNVKGGIKEKIGAIPIVEPKNKKFQESSEHSHRFQYEELDEEEYKRMAESSMEIAAKAIKKGETVVMFAEGPVMNQHQKEIRRSSRGPARLLQELRDQGANDLQFTIVPVAINGSSRVVDQPIDPFHPKYYHKDQKVDLAVGEAVDPQKVESASQNLQEQSDFIMSKVAEMMPEELQGPYKEIMVQMEKERKELELKYKAKLKDLKKFYRGNIGQLEALMTFGYQDPKEGLEILDRLESAGLTPWDVRKVYRPMQKPWHMKDLGQRALEEEILGRHDVMYHKEGDFKKVADYVIREMGKKKK